MRASSSIRWVVEARGVTLFHMGGHAFISIPYPYAGLWALIAHGNYTNRAACELLVLLGASTDESAPADIERTLGFWAGLGLIERGEHG